MINLRRRLSIVIGCLAILALTTAHAANFIVKNIKINGLQGISQETVLTYLPVKVGQRFDTSKTGNVLKQLYQTGFFDHVSLAQQNQTLIVNVKQRPIISRVDISGNKTIPKDKLQEALNKMNFVAGQIFSPLLLTKVKTSLAQEYFYIGKYHAIVNVKVIPQKRNRVAIDINVSEGKIAKIKKIDIIGSHAFSEKTLLKQFKLTTSGLLTFFNKRDQYSEEKLGHDLEALQNYYMNRGYIKFKIDSSQVSITPDKKHVYIAIHVSEGSQYRFGDYHFSGQLILPEAKLRKMVQFKKGDIFSREVITHTSKIMGYSIGDKGYANVNVNPIPKFDEKNRAVSIEFHVEPGKRVYVRHITFSNNYRTNDVVLRRALLQFEGSLYSNMKIDGSKRELLMLPSGIKNVNVSTKQVPNKPNQLDVNYQVEEAPSAMVKATLGYSEMQHFMIGGGLTQKNVFGTGNALSFNVMDSHASTNISLSYNNPYYTKSGVGRSISAYSEHFNGDRANISDYAMNTYGVNVGYNFRFSQNDSVQLGYGYENDLLKVSNSPSEELSKFVSEHGRHFNYLTTNLGWAHNTFDRMIFPTKGLYQTASVAVTLPVSHHSLTFYKLNYGFNFYHPIYKGFIGLGKLVLNYGNGYGHYQHELPFFKNFYAGGMTSLRGYEGNSLGPRDSLGDPLGGKFEVNGSIGMVFPNFISDNLRTSWFIDGGTVQDRIKWSGIRYSTGIAIDWYSPVGLLNFAFAKAINRHRNDETNIFDFNIGTSF